MLAATKGLNVTVPVIAASGAATTQIAATTTALQKQAAASEVAGASAVKTARATTGLAKAQTAAATAAKSLALAQGGVANAATAAGAAQVTATRSTAAVAAAERSLGAALAAKNIALIDAAAQTLRLARAQEIEASTALAAARAQTAHASSLGFVQRGAGATGLSLLGVRGATLAANSAFLAGAAAVAVFAKSIGVAASLEKQLNVFAATSGATADEIERVSRAARELGRDIALPAVSASDAAAAMTELAKASLSVEDSLAGARGVLLLSTAAQLDAANATEIVASALNAFGLEGQEAVRVADLLAGASIAAQGSIADMGGALTQAASVSRQVGISLEDTVALLTLLAKNGIQGAGAGTVLRVALLRLVNPAGEAAAVIEKLGLNIRDAQGRIRPEIFAEFEEATRNLTKAQRDAAAAQVFGVRGIRAQAILGRESITGLDAVRKSTQETGQAQELAAAQTEGFTGKLENLRNQLEEAGVTLGNLAKGPLGLLVDSLSANVQIFNLVASAAGSAAGKVGDFVAPVVDVGRSFLDTTNKAGNFLDKLTEGIPVLDDFFTPLRGGTDDVEELGNGFEEAQRKFEEFFKFVNEQLAELEKEASRPRTGKAALGKLAGLEEQILDVRAGGGGADAELTLRRQELDILNQRIKQDNLTIAARRKLKRERDRVLSEIEAIEREMATDAKKSADEVDRARLEADAAFLDMLGGKRAAAQNQILKSAGTEGLKDDIKTNEFFLALIKRQIDLVKKTVSDAKARAGELRDLTRQLIQVTNEIESLRQEQREALQQRRQEQRERIRERLSLSIQIAEATGNRSKEIRAREAEIKRIQEEIRQTRRNSLQRKRLILELREAQRTLRELKAERDKTADEAGRTFAQESFEFLQTQQGFAANLFGNLIPTGAATGLVGQPTPPTPAREVSAAAQVREGVDRGVSQGQFSVLIDLTRQMLNVLRNVDRGQGVPEIRRQELSGRAMLDILS